MTRLRLRGSFDARPEAESDPLPFPTGGVWSLRDTPRSAPGRRRSPARHPAERALDFVQERLDALSGDLDEALHLPDFDPDRPAAA